MEKREEIKKVICDYFKNHTTGTAKEIYNKTGRIYSHSSICNELDKLQQTGKLIRRIVPATKYKRAHYVFVRINKKEPLIKRLFKFFFNIPKNTAF